MLFSKVSTVLQAISRTLSGFSRTKLSLPYKYKSDNNPSFFTKGMIVFPDMNEETFCNVFREDNSHMQIKI